MCETANDGGGGLESFVVESAFREVHERRRANSFRGLTRRRDWTTKKEGTRKNNGVVFCVV